MCVILAVLFNFALPAAVEKTDNVFSDIRLFVCLFVCSLVGHMREELIIQVDSVLFWLLCIILTFMLQLRRAIMSSAMYVCFFVCLCWLVRHIMRRINR